MIGPNTVVCPVAVITIKCLTVAQQVYSILFTFMGLFLVKNTMFVLPYDSTSTSTGTLY